jgi:hypothetical protein
MPHRTLTTRVHSASPTPNTWLLGGQLTLSLLFRVFDRFCKSSASVGAAADEKTTAAHNATCHVDDPAVGFPTVASHASACPAVAPLLKLRCNFISNASTVSCGTFSLSFPDALTTFDGIVHSGQIVGCALSCRLSFRTTCIRSRSTELVHRETGTKLDTLLTVGSAVLFSVLELTLTTF